MMKNTTGLSGVGFQFIKRKMVPVLRHAPVRNIGTRPVYWMIGPNPTDPIASDMPKQISTRLRFSIPQEQETNAWNWKHMEHEHMGK
jgi:hypothetical protein